MLKYVQCNSDANQIDFMKLFLMPATLLSHAKVEDNPNKSNIHPPPRSSSTLPTPHPHKLTPPTPLYPTTPQAAQLLAPTAGECSLEALVLEKPNLSFRALA